MTAERDLLAAVVEALTLPFDAEGYDQRLLARASVVRVVVREALAGDPARLPENTEFLRRKLGEEQAGR